MIIFLGLHNSSFSLENDRKIEIKYFWSNEHIYPYSVG